MNAKIVDANGGDLGSLGSITNMLANVSPRIEVIDDTKKHLGRSQSCLFFNTMRVGQDSPSYPIACPSNTECTFSGEYGGADTGYL